MSKDYKNAGRRSGAMTGTAGLLLGLAIGLGVAAAVFIYDRRPSASREEPAPSRNPARARAVDDPPEESGRQFDFYEMLPKFEVVVPEREKPETPGARPAASERRAGAYVLQVGSYRNFADADRARAQLALQGFESKIQRVSVDNDTWHRVRIGPISDLAELNRTEQRLRQADMQPLVIRIGE